MATDQYTQYTMRPMKLDDLETVTDWSLNFDDAALFERNLPIPVGPEHISDSWKQALEFHNPPKSLWYVATNSEKVLVGMCGLEAINYIHGDAIIPVFVAREARAQRLAVRMACCVIDMAFDTLRLHRLTTHYRADHPFSKKTTTRLGFVDEGCAREAWFSDGNHKDVIQVGLLKSDWYSLRNTVRDELKAAGKPAFSFYSDIKSSLTNP